MLTDHIQTALHIHRARRRRQGMTLMEVMIVLAIIILLMGVLTFGLKQLFTSAQRDAAQIQLQQIDQKVELFRIRHKRLPKDLDDLYRGEDTPTDPWGNDYQLTIRGERDYDLLSYGPDGQQGGDGADEDIQLERQG
jgi:general secretion pathway protein G